MSTSAKEGNRTDRRIINEIEKLNASIAVKDRSRAILIADSKGRELRKQRNPNMHFNIQYQPGAKLRNVFLDASVKRHITNRSIRNPIVLIWLGTCEFTVKTVNGYKIQDNIDTHIDRLIILHIRV